MTTRWFRIYEGMLTDAKLHEAAVVSETSRSVTVTVWVALLESCAISGSAAFQTSPRRIAATLCEPLAAINRVFEAFEEIGLIAGGQVVKWDKRQFVGDHSAERVRRFRERQRNGGVTLQGVTETPPYTDSESETEKETENIIINDDESLSVFPRDGSIEFTGWAAIVREAGRNIDVDDLASAFRKWCWGKDILFDDKRIEKTFRTFVATHNAKPPGGESSESRDFRPMTVTPVPSVFIADNSPEWQAFVALRRKQGRPALKIADGQRGQGQWVKAAEIEEVRAILAGEKEKAA